MIDTTPRHWIAASKIVPGHNDRTIFDPAQLAALAENIRQHGLLNALHVRPLPGSDLFEIIAGERRYRACTQYLHWQEVPCVIEDVSDEEAAALMLAENTARAELNPIDEARAYQARINAYTWTPEKCAQAAGVSLARVQQRLRLLSLRPDLQQLIATGNLSIGYALIIAQADLDPNRQSLAAVALRDNPRPTQGWLRHVCSELANQQAQADLFDLPLISGQPIEPALVAAQADPPSPGTAKPPRRGRNAASRIQAQANFWGDAAAQWDALGKPFKRNECLAAQQAAQLALEALN